MTAKAIPLAWRLYILKIWRKPTDIGGGYIPEKGVFLSGYHIDMHVENWYGEDSIHMRGEHFHEID